MNRVPEAEVMDTPERAAAYAHADFSTVNAAFVDTLLEHAGDRRECVCVDLGTGPGEIPRRLAEFRPDWRVAAVDASLPMLRIARTAAPGRRSLMFTLTDAKRLPFADRAFDVVFSNSLLHHLPDPLPFWREIRRVARPGALVLVRDLVRPASTAEARRLVDTYAAGEHPLLREDFYNSFLAAFTIEEVRGQLVETGLGSLDVAQVTDRHMDVFVRL